MDTPPAARRDDAGASPDPPWKPPAETSSAGSLLDEWLNENTDAAPLAGAAATSGAPGVLVPLRPARSRGRRARWIAGFAAGGLLAVAAAWGVLLLARPSLDDLRAEADRAYQSGEYAAAVEGYEKLLRRAGDAPSMSLPRVRLGVARLEMLLASGDLSKEQLDAAAGVLSEIAALEPFVAEAQRRVGELLLNSAERLAVRACGSDASPVERLAVAWQAVDLAGAHAAAVDPWRARLHRVEYALGRAERAAPVPTALPRSASPIGAPGAGAATQRDATTGSGEAEVPRTTPSPPANRSEPPAARSGGAAADEGSPSGHAPDAPPRPEDLPLWRREPFDEITLTAAAGGAVLRVAPLDLPDRRLPDNPGPDDKLVIRLLDRPGKQYEVKWQSIARVELFESMVLADVRRRIGRGEFGAAYEGLESLHRRGVRSADWNTAMTELLYEEAKAAFRAGDAAAALARLREVHRRDARRAGLDRALAMATEARVKQYLAQEKPEAARALLSQLAAAYPNHPTVTAWETKLQSDAAALLDRAKQAAAAERWAEVSTLCRAAERAWPAIPGAAELARLAQTRLPRIVVAVESFTSGPPYDGGSSASWEPGQRTEREAGYRRAGGAGNSPGAVAELVERTYPDAAQALVELARGDVQIVARVPPWRLGRLAGRDDVVVKRYARPSFHGLVAHPLSARLRNPLCRRALAYAIHREAILKELLGHDDRGDGAGEATAGDAAPRGAVVDGVFFDGSTCGSASGAPASAGQSRAYDPHLAMILLAAAEQIGESPPPDRRAALASPGTLVLAHGPDEVAALACGRIAEHWKALGVSVALRRLPSLPPRAADDVDLLYVELSGPTPTDDARRLFDEGGWVGDGEPAIRLLMGRLEAARSGDPRGLLRQLDERVVESLPILPLWRLDEHLAHRRELVGVVDQPGALYDQVENWSLAPPPSEARR